MAFLGGSHELHEGGRAGVEEEESGAFMQHEGGAISVTEAYLEAGA